MSNKETLQEYNARLSENNKDLDNLLTMVNNLDDGDSSGGGEMDNYSTTETVIGTWYTGKPIYRKVIKSSAALIGGINNIKHNISSFGELVDARLFFSFMGSQYVNNAFENETTFVGLGYVDAYNVTVYVGSSWGNSFKEGVTIILEYTKTTD